MRAWYHNYGFDSNPFSIKPAAFSDAVVGYRLDDVFEKIDSGNVLFFKGNYGFGKTTVLKHLIRRFGGKKRVIYHSTSRGQLDVEKLLLNRTFMNRVFKSRPYDMILLVDEAQELSKNEVQEINRVYNEGNIKSVVFMGTAYQKNVFTKEFNQALKGNVVVLGGLGEKHAVELVRMRVGNIQLLSDEVISRIYRASGPNPRRFLEMCEDACRHAFEAGKESVDNEVLEHFTHKQQKKGSMKKLEKKKLKTKKIKQAKRKPKSIIVQEIDSRKMQPPIIHAGGEYNLDNVRTYEEEMHTLKEENRLKEEK